MSPLPPSRSNQLSSLGFDKEGESFTQQSLLNRAADYFAQARKPRTEWKTLDDFAVQLAEFDLRCKAGDYNTATSVLKEIDYDFLFLWGHYRLLIDLHEKIEGVIRDTDLQIDNLKGLDRAYSNIGLIEKAIAYLDKGLALTKETKNRKQEGVFLSGLGSRHAALGNLRKAIEYSEQALIIAREIGARRDEVVVSSNLGNRYADLGDKRKAIQYYEQGLAASREIHNRRDEGNILTNLGLVHAELGEAYKAIEYYEQALVIAREVNDRKGESQILENSGHTYLSITEIQKASTCYLQAIHIADEISFAITQNYARWGLAQIYLSQNALVNARITIEVALQHGEPENNHNATALHGIIALRQGERANAQEAFSKSIAQADEILAKTPDYYSALDAKGLALCGLAITTGDSHLKDDCHLQAIETFRKARKIAPHAGVVKSVLRLFDELVKCEGGEILKDVRKAVEGVE